MINIDNLYKYCAEDVAMIENYQQAISDNSNLWVCHHRLEIQGNKILSAQELRDMGLYYHRPACELILLTHSDHITLHNKNRAESTFKKISTALKGNKNCLGRKLSDETKKKMSIIMTGNKNCLGREMSAETRKKMSESLRGHTPWIKGKKHTEETKQKMKKAWTKRKQKEIEVKYTKGS